MHLVRITPEVVVDADAISQITAGPKYMNVTSAQIALSGGQFVEVRGAENESLAQIIDRILTALTKN